SSRACAEGSARRASNRWSPSPVAMSGCRSARSSRYSRATLANSASALISPPFLLVRLTVAKEKMGRCSLGTADGDGGGRVTGGAVGRWLRLDRGLGVAGLVGGAGFEQVVARCRGPLPDPLPPRVDVGHRGQPCLMPRAAVDPDLHGGDALVLRPRHPGHRRPPRAERSAAGGHVDPG